MSRERSSRAYNGTVISDGAAEPLAPVPDVAVRLAWVHGADDLTYHRLHRMLETIGLRTHRIGGHHSGDRNAAAAVALVIANRPSDWKAVVALRGRVDTVVLTAEPSARGERRALELGAIGYLPLHLEDATLRKTVSAILEGQTGFSRTVLGQWLRGENLRVLRLVNAPALTRRQQQILERIARGEADKQIARHLGIATATVHKHVQALLRRLGVPNRAAAVRYAEPTSRPSSSSPPRIRGNSARSR